MRRFALSLALLPALGYAQGTADDYRRAQDLPQQWRELDRPFQPRLTWLDGGAAVHVERSPGEHLRIDVDGTVRRAKSAKELGLSGEPVPLPPQQSWRASGGSGQRTTVRFENRLDRAVRLFWIDGDGRPRQYGTIEPGKAAAQSTFAGHVWLADFAANDLAGVFVAETGDGIAIFDERSRALAMTESEVRPVPAATLFVRDHDVFGRDADGTEFRLTTDGKAEQRYELPDHWSPDGARVLGFCSEPEQRHELTLVESTPKDQLQPKRHVSQYLKPGDRITQRWPRLYDVRARRAIAVDALPFAEAWSIDHVHWAADGREVFVLYNRRGHQLLRLYGIDAATGAVRTVLEEASATFVDYSQKTFLHWLAGDRAFLWTSERDGWNHLYRVDVATGAVQQITRGDWLVRDVEFVDEAAGQVWLKAYGLVAGQDPYFAQLVRIDLDGANRTLITAGDGTHEWQFSPNRELLVDRWSRVDQPGVTELRRARDGALLCELGRQDDRALRAAGFRPPEPFVAKGRDGKTDIHGVLILPSTFDARRRYPVIEDIYAGPQDHFVPKAWGLGARQRTLAELGFVVVQIDGMGTNWRARAFHDVAWRNLKDGGLPDRIVWLREAARSRPWLDLDRVGIFGGSAGGQNALAAMLHHGDFYKAAAADCGCHDNRMDKIWWNEAWMGWPVGPWYADNSNVTHAGKLQGPLLLTVGELDRNVDPASTMQVVAALIAADKDFDLVVVPGGGHGIGESPYLVRRRQDFFVRHLLGVEPRRR
ncbi:MAG: prolyl oligopeptidase family serine peptidase [Planctomycetes bacterium]|nr:prolyl oligopeptidase family serine peptidase [Planctomycetota bacterium]